MKYLLCAALRQVLFLALYTGDVTIVPGRWVGTKRRMWDAVGETGLCSVVVSGTHVFFLIVVHQGGTKVSPLRVRDLAKPCYHVPEKARAYFLKRILCEKGM